MLRIEGILRVIAQDSLSPGRVQSAGDSVAKLRAQLVELQQSEAALDGQVGCSPPMDFSAPPPPPFIFSPPN